MGKSSTTTPCGLFKERCIFSSMAGILSSASGFSLLDPKYIPEERPSLAATTSRFAAKCVSTFYPTQRKNSAHPLRKILPTNTNGEEN
ncbi:hypothetical protein TNCV_3795291 [Trichonephila clavipes]|nr:hypothetical protein TNCV_3795291 [Trichonephila clavipes]